MSTAIETAHNEELGKEIHNVKEQYITFRVSEQEYGVSITSVREIKGWTHTTKLPNSPSYMRGVVNLRGTVVPILDLRSRFGMGTTDVTPSHVVMIVALENRMVGVLVDAVCDILSIEQTDIRAVPNMNVEEENTVVNGLVQKEERMVALLDLSKVFDASVLLDDHSSMLHSLTQEINNN